MITTELSMLGLTKLTMILVDNTNQLYQKTIEAAINNPNNAFIAAVGCGIYSTFKYYSKSTEGRSARLCHKLLDDVEQNPLLAMEYLQEGIGEMFSHDVEDVPSVHISGMEVTSVPVKEHRHRRLPHKKHKHNYMQSIIAEIKVKLGTPQNSEANRQIIRRTARGLMETHGLRPTHQASILPIIIEAVLTPGNMELEATMWAKSNAVRQRRGHSVGWMDWFFRTSPSNPHC